MKTLWLPFNPLGLSRIRCAWKRRSLLVLAVPVMTVFWSLWVIGVHLVVCAAVMACVPFLVLRSIGRHVLNIYRTTPAAARDAWDGKRQPAVLLLDKRADPVDVGASTSGPPETIEERMRRTPRALLAYAKDIERYGKPLDSGLPFTLRFAAASMETLIEERDL